MIKLVTLPNFQDGRGTLTAIEQWQDVPFEIKRVYYITGAGAEVSRGFHAHKKLQQLAVCLSGSCRFVLKDGILEEHVVLDSPTKGLLIEEMVWREMYDFTEDCTLLVLANEHFSKADYIYDYGEFVLASKSYKKNKNE